MVLILKHALRRLGKAPGFTATAVLMLALGVAMSTLSFTTASGVLLRPLPFPEPEQLVGIQSVSPKESFPLLAPGNAMDIRDQLADVGEFALYGPQRQNVATAPGDVARQQNGMWASANVLRVLGIQPALGRGFLPGEDEPNQPPVMLLTDRSWRELFSADPGVLGKTVRVETTNFTVIGVLPPSFDHALPWSGCMYVTLMTVWPNWRTDRGSKWLGLMGRLRPGVSLRSAQVRLDTLARQIAHDHPVEMADDSFRAEPLGLSRVAPQIRMVYWLVLGLSLLVLIIACANLGAVQLARAFSRHGELAIRTALGATRIDLVAALAVESILLALGGTVTGLILSYWTAAMFSQWIVGVALPVDARVVAFGAVAGLLAMLCFGIAPAWLITGDTTQILKERSRRGTGGPAQNRFKYALIVSQLSLALVLVSTAASLVLGVRAFTRRALGWRPDGLVAGAFHPTWDWVTKELKEPRLAGLVETKLGNTPGVESVAIASNVFLSGDTGAAPLFIEGADPVTPGREPQANVAGVNGAFFRTLGITLQEGRLFPAKWRRTDPPIAVISTTLARRFWPNGSAVGKRIRLGPETAWREIIGVVSDAMFDGGYTTPATLLQVYHPIDEAPSVWYSIALRSRQPAAALEKTIRADFNDIDPDIMVDDLGDVPMSLANRASVGPLSPLLLVFATSGLVIALVGLYGVMSQFAEQRRREIGVRIALGADAAQVVRLMLARGATMLIVGGVMGIGGSYAVAVAFHRALPELPMFGILGDGLVAMALIVAGLGACYLPSARAARVNPIEVLRAE